MTQPDPSVIVAGAGPAGLMAAEIIAQQGFAVTLYDAMPSPARKFLMAGRGGLNLTHSEPLEKFLSRYSPSHPFIEQSIRGFDPAALRIWADALGAETFVGSSGRIFPQALKASPLLRAWLRRLSSLGVVLKNNHRLVDITGHGAFVFQESDGNRVTVQPRAAVLALGGASWPRLGSTGTWRDILLRRGISVASFQPSNMGFQTHWTPHFYERFTGTPLKNIIVSHDGHRMAGEAMITRDGLEGGVIYALSPHLRQAIARDGMAIVSIDLKPAFSATQLAEKFQHSRKAKETQSHFLKRVAGLAPAAIGMVRETTGNALPADAVALADAIKNVTLPFHGAQGLERAISSAGGISLDAIDAQFMLKKLPGIFAAGEMLDWEAPTGGYLLQATFSTAVAAAHGVCNYLQAS